MVQLLWILLFENDCFIKMLPTFLLSFSMFVRTWGVREICERLVRVQTLSYTIRFEGLIENMAATVNNTKLYN